MDKSYIRSKQKYGIISQNIMRNPFITPTAKALYSYLASFAGSENTAFPGRDLICHDMGFNKDTFTKYMWELECWEIVQKEKFRGQGGQFDNNVYILDHYPELVMIDRKLFEESYWPELEELIKSKKRKPNKTASSPCPKFSDTVESGSPCPKIPDMVIPDPVEPDPVFSDTNINSLNINNINNNSLNNNNGTNTSLELFSTEEQKKSVVVVSSNQIIISKEGEQQSVGHDVSDPKNTGSVKQIFTSQNILGLPDPVIEQLASNYTPDELNKIAQVLREKKEQGHIKNPAGLLVTGRDIPDAILRNEFYPDKKKKSTVGPDVSQTTGNQYSEYEIYVPPSN